MMVDDKIGALAERVRRGEDVTVEDVAAAYDGLEFNRKQLREILRHVKWLAKQIDAEKDKEQK